MKILLHICCAPCAIYPIEYLRSSGFKVTGYFFNHNIHPYQEYRRRLETVREYADSAGLEVIYRDEYLMEDFLKAVADKPDERCIYCYTSRLETVAEAAASHGFTSYSSTLLYSRYQKHDLIRQLGEQIGYKHNVKFHYEDFRRGWQKGIELSKKLDLYRQQYCGCIYSERERYQPRSNLLGGRSR